VQSPFNETKHKPKVWKCLGYTYKLNTEPYVQEKKQNFTVREEKSGKENMTYLCFSFVMFFKSIFAGKLYFA